MIPSVRTAPSPSQPTAELSPLLGCRVEPLQGWHLPLLEDPALLPLQSLLQRQLLLSLPRRLAAGLGRRSSSGGAALVALSPETTGRPRVLGVLISRPLNRRGSCWEVQHLRLALTISPAAQGTGVAASLLREALQRTRGASSWVASASSLDAARLALLREQGFQPQRLERVWRWQPAAGAAAPALPAGLQLRPLQARNAALLWHLEQATCPAPLRQMLDRRIEDLLDRSDGRGWLLIDAERNEAVAGARWLAPHPAGGQRIELSVHPGWGSLLGPPCELLLHRLARRGDALWLHSPADDAPRQLWLEQLGAQEQGEEVLMARSLWRRQEAPSSLNPARRLSAVLETLQPGRRSVPTPIGPR